MSKRRASSGGAPACKRLRTAAKPAEAAQLSAPLEPKEPPQREAPRAFSPRITACQLASVADSAQQTATGALLACPPSATPIAEPAAIAGACLNCVCSCHGFFKKRHQDALLKCCKVPVPAACRVQRRLVRPAGPAQGGLRASVSTCSCTRTSCLDSPRMPTHKIVSLQSPVRDVWRQLEHPHKTLPLEVMMSTSYCQSHILSHIPCHNSASHQGATGCSLPPACGASTSARSERA